MSDLKVGMSVLTNDDNYLMVIPNIIWNSKQVDHLVCAADRPSRMLENQLKLMAHLIPNFTYLGASVPFLAFPQDHTKLVNPMVQALIEKGMDWIINLDDDEFLVGDIKEAIKCGVEMGANTIYENGYCFYETELDRVDANPVRRMLYRDPDTVDYDYRKVIHRADLFMSMTPGNHYVQYRDVTSIPYTHAPLKIYHYTYRLKRTDFKKRLNYLNSVTEDQIISKKLVIDESLVKLFDERGLPV